MIISRHVPAHSFSVFQLKLKCWFELLSSLEPGVSTGAYSPSPIGACVSQFTSREAKTAATSGAPPCSLNVKFTGTFEPALASLGPPGNPSIGAWKPPNCAVQLTGRSNACTPSVTLLDCPCNALKPSPRLANPRQIAH